jgi:hypothetical protein
MVYENGYLKELKFTCQIPDSSDTMIKDLSIHVVLYAEGKNNIAYLTGIESGTWRGIDIFSGKSEEFIRKFTEPYYDPNKKIKINFTVFSCNK